MKRLNDKRRRVFVVYDFSVLIAWLAIMSILYDSAISKMTLSQIGYDKIWLAAIGLFISVFIYKRYPLVRPEWNKKKPSIIILQTISKICSLSALAIVDILAYQLILFHLQYAVIFNEVVLLFLLTGISFAFKKFIIPAIKTASN